MRVKIFHAKSWLDLEQQVNDWLKTHTVGPESIRTEYSSVLYEDETMYQTLHTLILFYVPLNAHGFRIKED